MTRDKYISVPELLLLAASIPIVGVCVGVAAAAVMLLVLS